MLGVVRAAALFYPRAQRSPGARRGPRPWATPRKFSINAPVISDSTTDGGARFSARGCAHAKNAKKPPEAAARVANGDPCDRPGGWFASLAIRRVGHGAGFGPATRCAATTRRDRAQIEMRLSYSPLRTHCLVHHGNRPEC